jgi:3,4-dihydroxy 2-butanone 4-phosphate synthase/GTP cyclohydrolase II
VSIEAAAGITTGISAHDRAHTIRVAASLNATPADIVQPGHVFPLIAARGGVLARAGHTEACCDLARLAGLAPAAVLCEIMNDDGTMARLPQLEAFAAQHGLVIGTIADLIRYRLETESTVKRVGECRLPTEFGDFQCVTYHNDIDDSSHLALVRGSIRREWPILVRVHVQESLLDLFTAAHRPGITWSLRRAMEYVAGEGAGVIVVLQHRESTAELRQRIKQFQPDDVPAEAGAAPRGRAEMRTYGLGSQILADLGVHKMRVLGHPIKAPGMSGFGLEIVEYIEDEGRAGKDKKAKR